MSDKRRVAVLSVNGFLREALVLASASPRRAEILRAVGWPFEISAVDVDESLFDSEPPEAYVTRLALAKAETAAARHTSRLVLGADTTVVVDDGILGKPGDEEEAVWMLKRLSGRWHEVLTGVALVRRDEDRFQKLVAFESTRVRFGPMTDEEIRWHVSVGNTLDKAGAYAVQGAAALFIEEIQGDYWNVVGLPVQLVYKMAREMREEGKR